MFVVGGGGGGGLLLLLFGWLVAFWFLRAGNQEGYISVRQKSEK